MARATLESDWVDGAARWLPLATASYFALNAAVRLLCYDAVGGDFGAALGDDEAELFLVAQSLEAGYGPQPPLYAWLQWGAFQALGETTFALVLVKGVLLSITFIAMFALVRRLRGGRSAVFAVACLCLLPQIIWESQRALSNSVLAVAVASLALLVWLELSRNGGVWRYALFGALIGLGVLSKHNFIFFAAPLAAAALLTPTCRAALFNWRIFISAAIAAAIVAEPALWAVANMSGSTAQMAKFGIGEYENSFVASQAALGSLAVAAAAFAAPLLAVCGAALCFSRGGTAGSGPALRDGAAPFARNFLLAALTIIAVALLASGAVNVKDRWLQPVLFVLPAACAVLVAPRLTPRAFCGVVSAGGVAALLVAILLPINFTLGRVSRPSAHAYPFAEIVADIVGEGFAGVVLAGDDSLGGNAQRVLPHATVLTANYPRRPVDPAAPVLIIWSPTRTETAPPDRLAALVSAIYGGSACEAQPPQSASAPFYGPDHGELTLFFRLVPDPGAC